MLLTAFLFIIGFVFLIKGADFLVDGGSSIAHKLGVSSLVIGLTIVSFGTSAPELVINIIASYEGNTALAIGNVLGSNVANILLILGVAALICPIQVKDDTVWKEVPFSLLAVIVLFFMANDHLLGNGGMSELSRGDGLTMISFFAIFCVYVFGMAKKGFIEKTLSIDPALDHEHVKERAPWIAGSMVIIGMIGLALGGKWIVDGAVVIAHYFGMSEAFIGLTIIAVGTSLPELATAVVAALKKESDIVIGNVIGSNIFNILWVLALSSTIRPLAFTPALNQDIIMVIVATVLLLAFVIPGKENWLRKFQGGIFVALYGAYIIYLFYRG